MFAKHIHNIYTGRHALNIYKMSNNTLLSDYMSKKRVYGVYDLCIC